MSINNGVKIENLRNSLFDDTVVLFVVISDFSRLV